MQNNSDIFSSKLKQSIDNDNELLFGKILSPEELSDGTFNITISLVNIYMFLADLIYLNNNHNLENELPTPEMIVKEVEEVGEVSVDYPGQEVMPLYHPFFYEFKATSKDKRIKEFVSEHRGEWVSLSKRVAGKNILSIEGTFIFCASPLIARGNQLIFDKSSAKYDRLCKYIKATYSVKGLRQIIAKNSKSDAITDFYNLLPNNVKCINGTVYSVGFANNIEINIKGKNDEEKTILYDVGCTYLAGVLKKKIVVDNLDSFKDKRFDAVILSHWDMDHILAVGYYDSSIMFSNNMIWIAPDLTILTDEEITISAGRLAWYIARKCKAQFFNNLNGIIYGSGCSYFELWQGKENTSTPSLHKNSIGILVFIKQEGISVVNHFVSLKKSGSRMVKALFCGDCVYESIPDGLDGTMCDILVVPHHGSELTIPAKIKGRGSSAIISSDKRETKKRKSKGKTFPGPKHVLNLIKRGFNHIYITENDGNISFWICSK